MRGFGLKLRTGRRVWGDVHGWVRCQSRFLDLPARSKAHPGHAVVSSPQMQAFDSVHHLESLA
jgi:hypothetical protein